MPKLIRVRKNGKYTNVTSLPKDVTSGTSCMIREIADPVYSNKKILVIEKEPKNTVSMKIQERITEYKTPEGRLIMRERRVNARKESSSTVLTLTGFVQPGLYNWIDMGPAFVIRQPTPEEIQAMNAELNMETEE
jgi:hypothetical protein